MLDLVDPEDVAALLGEALDFHLVDRVGLTDFRLNEPPMPDVVQHHELPVTLARVVLPAGETSASQVDRWPVWFTRSVGRGKVVFTTLGPRGWHRPRTWQDSNSPYASFQSLPVPHGSLVLLADAARSARAEAYPAEALQSMLAQDIGYEVIGRGTVAIIFGLFLGGGLALWALFRRTGRVQLAGWMGPAWALAATLALFGLGQWSRRAAPPAIAFAQVVHAVDGTNEAAVNGVLAVYRPSSGTAHLGADDGGVFDLDMAGIEGQARRLIMTDLDAWHWENLALPAGVRFAPLQFTAHTAKPLKAVAHFGPAGLEGRLSAGRFRDLGDSVLTAGPARNLAVHLGADGTFTAGPDDALEPHQFFTGALLSDRQQQRQEIYRQVLKPSRTPVRAERPMLLAWAEPAETPFTLPAKARSTGTALLGIPLTLERSPAGTRATIPGMFLPVRRVLENRQALVPTVINQATTLDLRFQLPSVVLPFAPERARLEAKINARARRITVACAKDGAFVELFRVDNPLGSCSVDIDQAALLRPDAGGGIHVRLTVGDRQIEAASADGDADQAWTIEYIELEVTGRAGVPAGK
jgi:hypothetical protein